MKLLLFWMIINDLKNGILVDPISYEDEDTIEIMLQWKNNKITKNPFTRDEIKNTKYLIKNGADIDEYIIDAVIHNDLERLIELDANLHLENDETLRMEIQNS